MDFKSIRRICVVTIGYDSSILCKTVFRTKKAKRIDSIPVFDNT